MAVKQWSRLSDREYEKRSALLCLEMVEFVLKDSIDVDTLVLPPQQKCFRLMTLN